MMRSLLVVACTLFMVSSAVACLQSPEAVHRREINTLDLGTQTSKRDAGVLAKAKELRNLAEAAFKAQKYQDAEQYRHSALIAIGYKLETVRTPENAEGGQKPPLAAVAGCGSEDPVWTPPAD